MVSFGCLLLPLSPAVVQIRCGSLIVGLLVCNALDTIQFSCALYFTHPLSLILSDGIYSLHFKVNLGWARYLLLTLPIQVNWVVCVADEALNAGTLLV